MAYDSEIRRINIILKTLNPVFTADEFMKSSGIENIYDSAEQIANHVNNGYLKQIVRVTFPSGEVLDFESILDIPDRLFDIESNKMHQVIPDDIAIFYKKIND